MNNKKSICNDRRSFLKGLGILGGTIVLQGLLPNIAFASNNTKLLLINTNGGLDGLAALQPMSGALYSTLSSLRPTLAKSPGDLLSADSNYGFHPNLSSFKNLYDEGALTAILNVGYRNMSRSHLDSEIAVTRGVTDRFATTSSGLLNRIGAAYNWSSLEAISVTGNDPIFAGGDYSAVQATSLDDLYFRTPTNEYHDLAHLVNSTYEFSLANKLDLSKKSQSQYNSNFGTVVNTTDAVQDAVDELPLNGVYSQNQFGRALRSAEIALRSNNIGSKVVYMRNGGFDTHSNQEDVLEGLLTQFNTAFSTFVTNAKSSGLWDNLIVMVFSEFGRTNRENGSGGTDHGGANAVFLAGGKVNGGGIIGELTPSSLTGYGWLPPVYNIAEVYRRVITALDLDPDRIIPASEGPALTGLFS